MNNFARRSFQLLIKRGIARAVTCGVVLALPACNIPLLRHADPGPSLPPSINPATGAGNAVPAAALIGGLCLPNPVAATMTTENSGLLTVDEFYNDLQLTQLIHEGLMNNRELKILEEDVQIAGNEILARRGAYLPFLTVGGGGGFDRSSKYTRDGAVDEQLKINDRRIFNPLPNTVLGIDMFWQLDIWHQLRNAQEAAFQRYVAASEKRNFFVTKLVAEIAENYYTLMAFDNRLVTLDQTIALQEQSLKVSEAKKVAGQGTELAVQRFTAEVRKNRSEKLLVNQEIVVTENRINFLLNRYPQPIPRATTGFYDQEIHALSVGIPSQLLLNRPDIRQAERELAASGLDIMVARAAFYPALTITAGIGYEAFNPKYLFSIDSLIANTVGNLVAPLVNKKAIQADFRSANARQLQALYDYQQTVVNAFTEVVNRVTKVENYRKSIALKKMQLEALENSVNVASRLFQNARAEYIEVLFAQRDLLEARVVLIETKKEQLAAIVNAYQALGGGNVVANPPMTAAEVTAPIPAITEVPAQMNP